LPLQGTNELLSNPDFNKAFNTINEIRRIAYAITQYADPREYLWGLLLDSVFIATLSQDGNPQRERALLFGSVICERLGRWGGDWPPKGYPTCESGQIWEQNLTIKVQETKGITPMLPTEQQTALLLLTEATRFLFSELGKRLDFWRQKKGEKTPQTIEPVPNTDHPTIKFDGLEQTVNMNVLVRTQSQIETSMDILRKLTIELNGHRKQRLTDTLLTPKERAWLDNRIPELEQQINQEAERLQNYLDSIYTA
jgi:hypothetical protein